MLGYCSWKFFAEDSMRQLIAGNWKMNGTGEALGEIETLSQMLADNPSVCDVLVCPPATLIARAAWAAKYRVPMGGQDCSAEASGAFTGDISAEMLKDAGASAVIVGHSERRQYHGETNAMAAAKAKAAWRAGLIAIICIGETEQERMDGAALHVCKAQLRGSVPEEATAVNTTIAYEPVWAIGTGKTPTDQEIAEIHAHIRNELKEWLGKVGDSIRLLYGGSVRPSNAKEILALPEVGGALVGGASLKASDFSAIIKACAIKS
jgi:triosephosphate isomerase